MLGDLVDHFEMGDGRSDDMDRAIAEITEACEAKRKNDRLIGRLLRQASMTLLEHSMDQAGPERVRRIHHLGRRARPAGR